MRCLYKHHTPGILSFTVCRALNRRLSAALVFFYLTSVSRGRNPTPEENVCLWWDQLLYRVNTASCSRGLKPFSEWTLENVRTMGSGLCPTFAFHIWRTQQEILPSDAFTTQKYKEFSGEGWHSRQEVISQFHCRDHLYWFTANQHQHWPSSPKALESCRLSKLTSSSESSTWVALLFSSLDICILFVFFSFCHMLEKSSTCTLAHGTATGHRRFCSHIISVHFMSENSFTEAQSPSRKTSVDMDQLKNDSCLLSSFIETATTLLLNFQSHGYLDRGAIYRLKEEESSGSLHQLGGSTAVSNWLLHEWRHQALLKV